MPFGMHRTDYFYQLDSILQRGSHVPRKLSQLPSA